MHANTLLQNPFGRYEMLLAVLLPYEFTLLQNYPCNDHNRQSVLLPYEFTLLQNLKRRLKLLPVHVSQGFSIAFYYITSLLSEKHIECHACANLFNYPAILHLSKCSNRHLKLLPAQNARNYTTPKLNFDLLHRCELFYYPAILHLFKCSNRHLKLLPAQNARNYTTPKLSLFILHHFRSFTTL